MLRYRLPLVSLLVSLTLFSGCAGWQPRAGVPQACYEAETLTVECFDALYARYAPILQAATTIAVSGYLNQYPQRDVPMYDLVKTIHARVSQDELTTLAQLEGIARDTIDWDALEPWIRLSAQTLLAGIRVSLEVLLADLNVVEPTQVRFVARDVVTWILAAIIAQCQACREEPAARRGVF